jgi:hypothetical protein
MIYSKIYSPEGAMRKAREIFTAVFRAWQRYHLSLVIAALLIICVVFFGLHDLGMILAYIATAIIIVDLTYRWRKIRYFFFLTLGAFVSAIFLSFLHEVVVKPLVRMMLGEAALAGPGFRIFSDAVSIYILFIGIMGILLGIAGMAVLAVSRLIGLLTRDKSARGT